MVQHIKPPLVVLVFHFGTLVQALAALFPVQHTVKIPGKAVEGRIAKVLGSLLCTWEIMIAFLALGFGLAVILTWGINQ